MNGVLAHEAKEIDIIKLASLVTREMMEIAKPRIAFILTVTTSSKPGLSPLFLGSSLDREERDSRSPLQRWLESQRD